MFQRWLKKQAMLELGMAQRKFAHCLGEFQFEYIGDAKTDDEKCIDESLQEFSSFLKNLEDQRELMMRNITETLMKPLEKFRKEHLGTIRTEKKHYEKETEKYYSSLEKLLNLSAKKKEPQLQEADSQVEIMRKHFQEESLDYVCKLQEIQERKKFECVEPMLAFFQTVFTFYHQGFELAKDFEHYKRALQINIQNTRSRFEATRSEVHELMKRVKDAPQEYRQTSPISWPPPFGSSWVKRYCTFVKEQKILHMVTFDHRSGGKLVSGRRTHQTPGCFHLRRKNPMQIKHIIVAFHLFQGETESVTLKSCVRKTTDMLDRRFCLDLDITDRPGTVLTVQALSEDDHKFWMQAMGGKEPVSWLCIDAQMDDVGLDFVKNSISAIEKRGINDQGLYRVAGVSSKVQKLLTLKIDEKASEVDLSANDDWDIKTITSSLKLYLRSLPEPLMTYGLYKEFISPAMSAVGDASSITTDETSMGSNESVSSQSSSASETPTDRPIESSEHAPLCCSLSSGSNKSSSAAASWSGPAPSWAAQPAAPIAAPEKETSDNVTSRKAKAVYPCEAEHDSELSFQVGAIFNAVTHSREPGWLEGELNGKRGLIPENYVEIL
ncbi:unnamed protein product [Tetraodon nigroviridis]|uniref:(spotted green pufferfish) hypothetical protein n=1 Tax=Tetraodon nigroviridis TaxID=99883 RepID=Q4RKL2_TETNG|nr:unnamed protein product [Tetraodon nigroviridis]